MCAGCIKEQPSQSLQMMSSTRTLARDASTCAKRDNKRLNRQLAHTRGMHPRRIPQGKRGLCPSTRTHARDASFARFRFHTPDPSNSAFDFIARLPEAIPQRVSLRTRNTKARDPANESRAIDSIIAQ